MGRLLTLEKQSIKTMIGLFDEKMANIVQFSGGKDSVVLERLARMSGLPFEYTYQNTTIDPVGHIRFIRTHYPDVKIIQPRYSFWQLIEKYGLPTRQNRFCCQHLKEYVGKGAKTFEGLRIDEQKDEEVRYSNRGKKRLITKRGRRLLALKEPEVCDTRVKDKIHVYPIMNWTTKDIWEYIHKNNIAYSDFYDKGFHRLGCIGCPLGRQEQRMKEYKMFPRFVTASVKAIQKNINAGRSIYKKLGEDPYEAFYWWISELSIEEHKMQKLFKINYKQVILDTFKIDV